MIQHSFPFPLGDLDVLGARVSRLHWGSFPHRVQPVKVVGGHRAISLQVPKGVQVQAVSFHSPTTSCWLPLGLAVVETCQASQSRGRRAATPGVVVQEPLPSRPSPSRQPRLFIFASGTQLFSFTFLFAGGWCSLGSGRSGEPQLTRELPGSPVVKRSGWPPPPAALPAAPHSAAGTYLMENPFLHMAIWLFEAMSHHVPCW